MLNLSNASKALGIDSKTLRRWVKRGCPHKLKKSKSAKGGRPGFHFDIKKVRAWAESESIAVAGSEAERENISVPPPSEDSTDRENLNESGIVGLYARLKRMEKILYAIVMQAMRGKCPHCEGAIPESSVSIRERQKKYIETGEALRRCEKEMPAILQSKGLSISVEHVRQAQAKIDMAIKTELLGLPRKMATLLNQKRDPAEVEDILTREIHECLRHLASGESVFKTTT